MLSGYEVILLMGTRDITRSEYYVIFKCVHIITSKLPAVRLCCPQFQNAHFTRLRGHIIWWIFYDFHIASHAKQTNSVSWQRYMVYENSRDL